MHAGVPRSGGPAIGKAGCKMAISSRSRTVKKKEVMSFHASASRPRMGFVHFGQRDDHRRQQRGIGTAAVLQACVECIGQQAQLAAQPGAHGGGGRARGHSVRGRLLPPHLPQGDQEDLYHGNRNAILTQQLVAGRGGLPRQHAGHAAAATAAAAPAATGTAGGRRWRRRCGELPC